MAQDQVHVSLSKMLNPWLLLMCHHCLNVSVNESTLLPAVIAIKAPMAFGVASEWVLFWQCVSLRALLSNSLRLGERRSIILAAVLAHV